jgi:hypothetical protein
MYVIPNTSITNNVYDGNDQGPQTFLFQADCTSGWVIVANQAIFIRVTVYEGGGLRPLPEMLIPPSVTPFQVAENGRPIRKIEFRANVTSPAAQVFGAFFTASDPSSNPNGINYGISSSGSFVPPVSTLQFQQDGVLTGAEQIADFVSTGQISYALLDDPGNFRMKIAGSLIPANIALPAFPLRIFDTQLAVATASFSISGIAALITAALGGYQNPGYHNLKIMIYGASNAAVNDSAVLVTANGDVAAHYDTTDWTINTAIVSQINALAQTAGVVGVVPGTSAPASSAGAITLEIPNFDNTALFKMFNSFNSQHASALVAGTRGGVGTVQWLSTAAITSLAFSLNPGSFAAGSRCSAYVF